MNRRKKGVEQRARTRFHSVGILHQPVSHSSRFVVTDMRGAGLETINISREMCFVISRTQYVEKSFREAPALHAYLLIHNNLSLSFAYLRPA